MVLDISLFRNEASIAKVKESQRRRYKSTDLVDEVIKADKRWRNALTNRETYSRQGNFISKEIGAQMKAKKGNGDTDDLDDAIISEVESFTAFDTLCVRQLKTLKKFIDEKKADAALEETEAENERDDKIRNVGNLVHDSVPVSDDEANNEVVRIVGEPLIKKKYSHVDLIVMINGVDSAAGSVVAGNRCYYLTGPAVFLAQAVTQLALRQLGDKGFVPVQPPYFMNKNIMQEVAQLSQFDEELYKVTGKGSELASDSSTSEKYLIATSEQPLAALHRDQWMDKRRLPLKYAGVSTCFRQEVGSHGRDTRGIFRVHQFDKVEQFVLCSPEEDESWKVMDGMLSNAEDFLKSLRIPYHVVNIVSKELNLAASKKLDIEAWFPGGGAFREVVSCSNCLDYQSRRLRVRFGVEPVKEGPQPFVHMLNSTLCAVTRIVCALLENNQVEDGIEIPPELAPYMPSMYCEKIPFVAPAPIDEVAVKEEGGSKKKKKAVVKSTA